VFSTFGNKSLWAATQADTSEAQAHSGIAVSGTQTTTKAPNGAAALPHAVVPSATTSPTTTAPRQDPSGALLNYLLGDGN